MKAVGVVTILGCLVWFMGCGEIIGPQEPPLPTASVLSVSITILENSREASQGGSAPVGSRAGGTDQDGLDVSLGWSQCTDSDFTGYELF